MAGVSTEIEMSTASRVPRAEMIGVDGDYEIWVMAVRVACGIIPANKRPREMRAVCEPIRGEYVTHVGNIAASRGEPAPLPGSFRIVLSASWKAPASLPDGEYFWDGRVMWQDGGGVYSPMPRVLWKDFSAPCLPGLWSVENGVGSLLKEIPAG